jgi:hypothetical protein
MSILIFLIGFVIFVLFITGQVVEKRIADTQELDYKNYYERHSYERKKNPKYKKGSQSRVKNYNWKNQKL